MIRVYYSNTYIDIQPDDNAYASEQMMGEDALYLTFDYDGYLDIPVGAYCVFGNKTYYLLKPENFTKNGNRRFSYSLYLQTDAGRLALYRFKNPVDGRLKFDAMSKPSEYLKMVVDNINMRYPGWTVGNCIVANERMVSFNHISIAEALDSIAEAFETEWYISGQQIHLDKMQFNKADPLSLSYGKGHGFIPGVGRTNYDNSQAFDILYVQGGERNIDYSTYGSKTLHMPRSQTIRFDGEHFENEAGFVQANSRQYITDADGLSIKRNDKQLSALAPEASFDNAESYPKRVGKVSGWVVINADKHFYNFVDSSIPAALDYSECMIEGETMTVIFQTGMLAGREFDIQSYDHATRTFEIVPAEIDGQIMPNSIYKAVTGDEYIIYGCTLPSAYLCDNTTKTGAEWDLFKEAVRYMWPNEEARFTFDGVLDGRWAAESWDTISPKIRLGGTISFSDTQFLTTPELIRIIGIKTFLNKPKYPELAISNSPVKSSIITELNEYKAEEVTRERRVQDSISYTKRRWRDLNETTEMLQSALENYTDAINPILVETMRLIAGDESLQFRFVTSKTATPVVDSNFGVHFDPVTGILTISGGLSGGASILQHMTLGISSLSSAHTADEYKFWDIPKKTQELTDTEKAYYVYAKVSKSGTTGTFVLSETPIGMEEQAGYYNLLLGVLNSEYEGDRSFASVYGFTEILPGRVTTDAIVDTTGVNFFDLAGGRFHVGTANNSSYIDFNNLASNQVRILGQIQVGSTGLTNFAEYDDLLGLIPDVDYLKAATNNGTTTIDGGLILSNLIALGKTEGQQFSIYAGINGLRDTTKLGNGIAAWYGGEMGDKDDGAQSWAKSLFRFDGSGYLASGNIGWDANGSGHIPGISWEGNNITIAGDVQLGSVTGDTVTSMINLLRQINNWFGEDSDGNIYVKSNKGFYSNSFISAFGISNTGGGGGGLIQTVYGTSGFGGSYSDTDYTNTFNAYAINTLYDRIVALEQGAGTAISFDDLSSHPTTLAGYGITDAKIQNGVITLGGNTITPMTSIGAGTVTNAMLAGSIANGKLANSAITINGSSTALGGSFNTASITAGTAGTSSATSGLSIAIPYVTLNKYGIATAYGTHTHSISKANITSAIGSTTYAPYNSAGYLPLSGGTMTGTITMPISNDALSGDGIDFGTIAHIAGSTGGALGIWSEFAIYLFPGRGSMTSSYGLAVAYNSLTYNNNTVWHAGNANLSTVNWAANNLTAAGTLTVTGASTFNDNVTVDSTSSITLGNGVLTWDAQNSAWKLTGNLYATGFISAFGASDTGGSGGGGINLAAMWANLQVNESGTTGYNLQINPGHLTTALGTYVNAITTSGSGNAITAVSKSGSTLTFTKGSTFLTSHQSLANYVTLNSAQTITALKTSRFNSQVLLGLTRTGGNYAAIEFAGTVSSVEDTALGRIGYSPDGAWVRDASDTTYRYIWHSGNLTSSAITGILASGSIANGKLANSSITINGTSTSLGGTFNTASITAGTAGTSSATSGLSFAVPYVTLNAYGVATAYGTHTHTISASDLTTAIGDGTYLKLSGGTMTGDIVMTKGEYINASNGYAMLGLNGEGTTFFCGPGYTVSNSFLIRSANINLTHRKHTAASTYTDYIIYDSSNLTQSVVTGLIGNSTYAPYVSGGYLPLSGGTMTGSPVLSNAVYLRANNAAGTDWSIMGLNSSNNLLIGYGTSGQGYGTHLYGGSIDFHYGTARTIGMTLDSSGDVVLANNLHLANGKVIYAADTGGTDRSLIQYYTSNNLLIGYGVATGGYDTGVHGNNVKFYYGTSHTVGMTLDSDGDVTLTNTLCFNNNKTIRWKDTNGNLLQCLQFNSVNRFQVGYGAAIAGHDTYINGNNIYFRYGTTPTNGAIITSDGYVGIGTTSPTSKLHVSGGGRFDSNANIWTTISGAQINFNKLSTYTTGYNQRISFRIVDSSNTEISSKYLLGVYSTSAYQYMYLGGTYSDATVRITDSGVGIKKGNASPSYALDVGGSMRVTGATTLANLTVGSSNSITLGDGVLTWDSNAQAWKLTGNLYATGFISAFGASDTGGSGGGGINLAAMWANLQVNDSDTTGYGLQIHPGHLTTALGTYVNAITTAGSGNVVTGITKSGQTLTVTYGSGSGGGGLSIIDLDDNGTTTAGTWLASSSAISAYTDGLMVRYKLTKAGAATTTLNINGLGAKTVYRFNSTKLTTHYSVGSYLILIYNASLNSGCWITVDGYDSNTNTYVRQYVASDNNEYALLARYATASVSSYQDNYARFANAVTLNPSKGSLSATQFYQNGHRVPNITVSSTAPSASDGVVGDVWIQV